MFGVTARLIKVLSSKGRKELGLSFRPERLGLFVIT